MSAELFVGLMSGTSLDGVDAALVAFESGAPRCLGTHFRPYPAALREAALALQRIGDDELRRSLRLANVLADLYAETTLELLRETGTPADSVSAVGCHGQTLLHAPAEGYSLQLNNPSRLAEKTGITVVADFRSRDIAAGGQGAPLVPAFHDDVFGSGNVCRTVLNLGGIANLTRLAPGQPVIGFDCGPANMLLDAWAQRHIGTAHDAGGRWAAQGNVLPDLLSRLLAHPFFDAAPPKSCGREEFGIDWLNGQLAGDEPAVDVQATLLALTVETAAAAIERWCADAAEVYVCGGGAHNEALMRALAAALPGRRLAVTDELGLPVDWVEAVAFAWLAWRCIHGRSGNLPAATGARGARILGAIYQA